MTKNKVVVSKYPEHIKLQEVSDKSQACGDFVHWLCNKGYADLISRKRMEELLAEYFEIDLDKIEQEKRAMLEFARKG